MELKWKEFILKVNAQFILAMGTVITSIIAVIQQF